MVREFIRALFLAGLPVALASYALVWWSLRQGYLGPVSSVRDMEKGIKLLSKKRARDRKQRKAAKRSGSTDGQVEAEGMSVFRVDPVQNKWLAFGGGFYGIVGLLTYAVVEAGELIDFFTSFESLAALFEHFGFNMFVNLLVDAVMNFVVAIAWPVYWMSEFAMEHIWIWFGVAYLGYWAGVKLAVQRFGQGSANPASSRNGRP